VKAIFIAALDHEPGVDRTAYLKAACGEDADLRRRVEALLAAHDRADEILGPAGEQSADSVTTDSNAGRPGAEATIARTPEPEASLSQASITADHQSTAGQDVVIAGRYTLKEKIGEGGMGEVWVAKQTEPVKRKVALKLIKTGMDSRAVLARFEQERQALAMMDHPNIARVLDGGLTPGGQPFFVMELVDGLPLTKFCDEARLTPKERLELFVPICQAVQHAHQKGIVHRDLKPANILVTIIDGKPVPKVIDFGVAKATGGKLTDLSMSTQFGVVVGTLEYMSPEQAGFSGVDIDTRADIYSLGVILYELLTGLRPIDARGVKQAALTEMIRIIQEEERSKPSTRLSTDESLPSMAALRQTEPRKLMALPRGELDCLVMKCLEKKRDRRYDTANGLARDIQRYVADEPVEARPPSAGYRLSKFLRRNKGPVLAASLVLMALVAGLALASYGFARAKSERDIADKARIEAVAQKKIADKASVEALAQKKSADNQKQLAVENASKARESAKTAELRLADGLISQADALSLGGRFAEAHSLYTEAYDKFAELKAPMTAVEVALWSTYHQTTFPLLSFSGHPGIVRSVAIAPDGRTGLSGSDDKMLKLWDLVTGRELRTFTGHSEWVTSVAIAPDGRTALSASHDKTMKLWDLGTVIERRNFTGHSGGVSSVAIAPDGRTALSGSWDKTLRLWDMASGKELRTFTGHQVDSVAVAPDGRTVVSGSYFANDKVLKLWDFTRGVAHRAFEPRVAAAQGRLRQAAGDPAALATLGEWYAFRGMDHWAVDLLGRARERGAAVAPLTLTRCYWTLNRYYEARREFQIALEQSTDPAERAYLGWCIQAIDTEPETKRRQKAAQELVRRADRANSLGQGGMVAEAVAEVVELTTNPSWTAGQWYDFACIYSLASTKIAGKKKEYADRAMELLLKAVKEGWNNALHTANDTDLNPLRNREDFKKLMADLEKTAAARPGKEP